MDPVMCLEPVAHTDLHHRIQLVALDLVADVLFFLIDVRLRRGWPTVQIHGAGCDRFKTSAIADFGTFIGSRSVLLKGPQQTTSPMATEPAAVVLTTG